MVQKQTQYLHTKKIDFRHKIKLCTSVKLVTLHFVLSFLEWFWVLLMMATYKTRKLLLHVTCRNCKNNFGERYYFRPDLKNFPRKRWLLEVVWRSKFCLASLDAALRWLAHLHSLGLGNFVEHWFVEMVSLQAKSKMSKMTLHDYSEPLCTSQIEASTFPLPPFWAHPSNLIPFPAREGGHLITTHRGWGIFITSLDVMLRVGLIPYGFQ